MNTHVVLPKIGAFMCGNPFEAEEFVWLTADPLRAEALLVDRPSRYKVDKYIYVVSPTHELCELFKKLSNAEFKVVAFNSLKEFAYANCGVKHVSLIATWSH